MRAVSGRRNRRFTFQFSGWTGETDEYGGPINADYRFGPIWCRVQPLKGAETVMAARLSGNQPVVITVPWNPDIKKMTSQWSVIDEDGKSYDIKSVVNMDERREYLEVLAEAKT